MYAKGKGVPQDHAEAARWFRKAAEQGHASAQYNLGIMHANGEGVPQDHAEAVRLVSQGRRAGGRLDAQYNLGIMHYQRRGRAAGSCGSRPLV